MREQVHQEVTASGASVGKRIADKALGMGSDIVRVLENRLEL